MLPHPEVETVNQSCELSELSVCPALMSRLRTTVGRMWPMSDVMTPGRATNSCMVVLVRVSRSCSACGLLDGGQTMGAARPLVRTCLMSRGSKQGIRGADRTQG